MCNYIVCVAHYAEPFTHFLDQMIICTSSFEQFMWWDIFIKGKLGIHNEMNILDILMKPI